MDRREHTGWKRTHLALSLASGPCVPAGTYPNALPRESASGEMRDIKQSVLWIINLSGAIVNILLNLILIPSMGINGAAIASLITQIFANVIMGFVLKPIRANNMIMIKSLNLKYVFYNVKNFLR